MSAAGTLILYCVLVAGASLFGGWLPSRIKLTHTRMELIMSFVSGLMLGVALFHMLPHGAEQLRSVHAAGLWLAGGILVMFLHRPDQYDPEDRPGEAEIIVAKHRNGPTGLVRLTWRKEFMRFEDYTPMADTSFDHL